MDKRTQQSILNTVTAIVNKDNTVEQLASVFEHNLNVFEELFQIKLTEQQESDLIMCAVDHFRSNQKAKQIDLNEDIETIIENNSPEEVFISLCEWVQVAAALAPTALSMASSLFGGNRSAAPSTAEAWGTFQANKDKTIQALQTPVGQDRQEDPSLASSMGEDGIRTGKRGKIKRGSKKPTYTRPAATGLEATGEALARQLAEYEAAKRAGIVAEPPAPDIFDRLSDFRDLLRPFLREEHTIQKKKKKKVFKIIFVDKGVKKKGTAVSHKGVARIVSGKSVFKVFDERNNDVTSQFKKLKKHNKDEKK